VAQKKNPRTPIEIGDKVGIVFFTGRIEGGKTHFVQIPLSIWMGHLTG
jgi:hypothetical protein